jgi:hypothetical protein
MIRRTALDIKGDLMLSKNPVRLFFCFAPACLLLLFGPLAAAQPDPDYAKGVVTTEARDMSAIVDALDRYEKRAVSLDRIAKPPTSEIDALQSEGEGVKRALPSYQRALTGVIGKLKSTGKWTPDFDAFVETRAKADPPLVQELRKLGGARSAMEKASGIAGGLGRAVDEDVKTLRGKSLAHRLLEELTGRPVSALRADTCSMRYVASAMCRISLDGNCAPAKCVLVP